jgi:hypothetical protein
MKTIGMGTKPFFESSLAFYRKHCESLETGRIRIEKSQYFETVGEEQIFFEEGNDQLIDQVVKVLKLHGKENIRHVPFVALWNEFWYN